MMILRSALAVGALAFTVIPAIAAPFSSVVVFGDSNVDNGNLAAKGAAQNPPLVINPPPNFGGRNNNGPVVVEYLAMSLGVPLLDFAFSGASTARTAPNALIPGTLSQIDGYLASVNGVADPNALYVYWAGSNNLIGVGSDAALLATRISGAIADISEGLQELSDAGAGQIVVANRLPRTSLTSLDNLNGTALNAAIAAELPGLDEEFAAQVTAYDSYAAIEDMIVNPERYGFQFVAPTDLCISAPACANNLAVGATYVFWDPAHKTTRVHELMARDIAALVAVPEPASLALLAAGLAGLVASRRRAGNTAAGNRV